MCLGSARGHQARPHGTRRVSWLGSRAGTMQGLVPPWLGSRAPSKAPWHASHVSAWLTGRHQARPRRTCHVSRLGSWAGTMQGPVPSWLGSRAPSKAPWHLGLARGRAPCKALCHLGLARGHQARPHGTRRVSWLGSRAGTKQGPVPPWLGSQAPSKAPWHVSRVLAWLAGGHHARPRATLACLTGTKQGPVAPWLGSREGTMQGPVPSWLGSRAPCKAPWHASWYGRWHVSCVFGQASKFPCLCEFFERRHETGTGVGGSRPAEASKGRGDIAGGWRGWVQTSGPGPGKGGEGGVCEWAWGGGTNRSDIGLNLSGSWQQGHSATYNTPSRI